MSRWRLARDGKVVVGVLLAISLSGCASSSLSKRDRYGPNYADAMAKAEASIAAGQYTDALLQLADAGKVDPTNKDPWLKTARLEFDLGRYARAIVAAEEVLQRDPADASADGILTVAGFRMAQQSLERLQASGALDSESARREAEGLVTALRRTMGAEFLEPPDARTRRPATRPRPQTAAQPSAPVRPAQPAAQPASPPAGANSADPFRNIGGN